MIIVADTCVILDFLDGLITEPSELIRPYRLILMSPVALHETLRAYPEDVHQELFEELISELLPPPKLEHWVEAAQLLKKLYPKRKKGNIASMQNDILIALAARDIQAPVWSRDKDFELICNELKIPLIRA